MSTDGERTWGGRTLEDRRAQRREQLLDAGYVLLGDSGAAQVTVRGVCRAARLTERYFYESFDDREALLVAVHARVADEARAAIAAAVADGPGEPVARATAAVEAFVLLLEEDPRRGRVLLGEVFSDNRLARAGVDMIPAFALLLAEQIAGIFGALPEGPDALDGQLTSVALVGALAHLFSAWLEGTLAVSRERLVAHAVALIVAAGPVSSR
ncbi:TetR/AcrR family transcriptional regulator [Conexibacter sp. CPCC 205706]|uniref:TetR/AcrR family transcriptional regulator n=1 Tax=unclassified Conexibacter TaxID=2627773 RepID=UPI002721CD05|nr:MULTISPECIES: TetR/AcrR family transcriptional regulator [unclassified Conexibacter]MDO8184132.1 TetR/AcrR family transcriptional regulator [Conexibacter sp. CPCC 205706]MDO8197124.1 TetR/AcrR family transcriptional regulator [Conexibacter sp. CPCC 205762]